MSNPNEDSFHAPNPNHNVNSTYIYVVSWTKGLRYRPNRKQSGENRGIVRYINVPLGLFKWTVFVERTCVTLTTGVSGHVFRRTEKGKETLEGVLVEMPERTDAKGVQSVSWETRASECRSRRGWIGKSKAAHENKTYNSIVIISLLWISFIKSKHHYLSFPLRPIWILHIYIVVSGKFRYKFFLILFIIYLQ